MASSFWCGLKWTWPAVEVGWTHVLLQEEVDPLCVSTNPTVEKKTELNLVWIKQNISSIDSAHCNDLMLAAGEMVNLSIVTSKQQLHYRVALAQVSHLILTLCIRRRKEQMEVCLALERRNSAYLLENSMSPNCLLRSRPADSRCLLTKSTAKPIEPLI